GDIYIGVSDEECLALHGSVVLERHHDFYSGSRWHLRDVLVQRPDAIRCGSRDFHRSLGMTHDRCRSPVAARAAIRKVEIEGVAIKIADTVPLMAIRGDQGERYRCLKFNDVAICAYAIFEKCEVVTRVESKGTRIIDKWTARGARLCAIDLLLKSGAGGLRLNSARFRQKLELSEANGT